MAAAPHATRALALLAVALLGFAGVSNACFQLLGSAAETPEGQALAKPFAEAGAWDYNLLGDDWTGTCATGKRQSPVNIESVNALPFSIDHRARTNWNYPPLRSDGSNIEVIHNGFYLQVEWPGIPTYNATVSVAAQPGAAKVADILDLPKGARPSKRVNAKPIQFHFHANSENWVDGSQPPLEMHIVHTIPQSDLPGCDGTCYVALGVPFKLGKFNPVLDLIFRNAPRAAGTRKNMPAGARIDLGALTGTGRPYVTFEGGLTVPPCFEGILWHVVTGVWPEISMEQLRFFYDITGNKECTSRHHHHRHMLDIKEEDGAADAEETVTPLTTFGRSLTAEASPTCTGKAVTYGNTARNPQPWNGRTVRRARAKRGSK